MRTVPHARARSPYESTSAKRQGQCAYAWCQRQSAANFRHVIGPLGTACIGLIEPSVGSCSDWSPVLFWTSLLARKACLCLSCISCMRLLNCAHALCMAHSVACGLSSRRHVERAHKAAGACAMLPSASPVPLAGSLLDITTVHSTTAGPEAARRNLRSCNAKECRAPLLALLPPPRPMTSTAAQRSANNAAWLPS